MSEVRPARHCRHCLGEGCAGGCLIGGGACIHGWHDRPPGLYSWRLLRSRRWWHQVLWGETVHASKWS